MQWFCETVSTYLRQMSHLSKAILCHSLWSLSFALSTAVSNQCFESIELKNERYLSRCKTENTVKHAYPTNCLSFRLER